MDTTQWEVDTTGAPSAYAQPALAHSHSHIHTFHIVLSPRARAHGRTLAHPINSHNSLTLFGLALSQSYIRFNVESTTPPFPLHVSPLASSNGMGNDRPTSLQCARDFPSGCTTGGSHRGTRLPSPSSIEVPFSFPVPSFHRPLTSPHSLALLSVQYCTHSLLSIILAFPEWLNSERTSDPNYSSTTPSRTHVNSAALRRKQHRL